MLRVVLTLDCDRCKQSYSKAAVSTEPDSLSWESFAHDLKGCAAFDGWDTDGDAISCPECSANASEDVQLLPAALAAE